jgi:hypothetical protein
VRFSSGFFEGRKRLTCAETATGKQIVIDPMPMDQFEKEMTAMGLPPVLVLDLTDAYSAVGEFGCESRIQNGWAE